MGPAGLDHDELSCDMVTTRHAAISSTYLANLCSYEELLLDRTSASAL
jgi:hypothetical protein